MLCKWGLACCWWTKLKGLLLVGFVEKVILCYFIIVIREVEDFRISCKIVLLFLFFVCIRIFRYD